MSAMFLRKNDELVKVMFVAVGYHHKWLRDGPPAHREIEVAKVSALFNPKRGH
jgi:hypothetical protein